MNTQGSKAQESLVVALDGDKLGQIGGVSLALAVMAFCFFWRETDFATTAMRAGWAFVIGYGATFFLTRTILRTALAEMIAADEAKRPRGLGRVNQPEEGDSSLVDLEDIGLEPLVGREDTSVALAAEAAQ